MAGQARVHILFRATLDGLILRGPMIGGKHAFALVADWLGERARIDRDRALGELARRYLTGHGTRRRTRPREMGTTSPPRRPRRSASHRSRARPTSRRARRPAPRRSTAAPAAATARTVRPAAARLALPPARARPPGREVVTVNGIIKAIALIQGHAGGTWNMPRGHVDLHLWNQPNQATTRALRREAAAVKAYLAAED